MNIATHITSPAIPATEHPWTKARRLAKELSSTMLECDDGRQYVEVFPAGTRDFTIMFGDRDYYDSRSRPADALRALIADFEAAEAERIALAAQYAAVQEKIQKALGGKLCPEWKILDPNHAPAGIGRIPFSSCKEANERCDEAVRRARASHAAGFLLGRLLDRALSEIEKIRTDAVEHLRREEEIVDASGIYEIDDKVSAATEKAEAAWEALFAYRCITMADVETKVSVILTHGGAYPVAEGDVENLLRSLIGKVAQ